MEHHAKKRANDIRNLLGLGQRPIADIFSLLEDIGIVFFKKPLHNDSLSALFMQDSRNYLVIINSNKTLGHQIFSAAHELSHFYFDKDLLGGICNVNNIGQKNTIEKSADLFASHFLMPDNGVISIAENRKDRHGKLNLYDIVFLQQYFRVSWIAMLRKIKSLNYIDSVDDYKKVGITRLTKLLNYDTDLISKTQDNFISKKYLNIALKCYDNDEISKSKLEEYLSDIGIDLSAIYADTSLMSEGDAFED